MHVHTQQARSGSNFVVTVDGKNQEIKCLPLQQRRKYEKLGEVKRDKREKQGWRA